MQIGLTTTVTTVTAFLTTKVTAMTAQ